MGDLMRIGYARVSSVRTDRQDLRTQINLLTDAGCDPVLTERGSGARNDRPVMQQVLQEAIEAAERGETVEVVVVRLDRWGRSLTDVLASLERLRAAGVNFVSLTESIDLATPAGMLALTVLGAAAQYERALLRERILEAKRAKGPSAIGGRPRSLTPANVALARRMREQEGLSANAVAAQFGVSRSTLLRALRREDLAAEAS
jgi:DNA invertase Pin-like site-specific DNA recombinase